MTKKQKLVVVGVTLYPEFYEVDRELSVVWANLPRGLKRNFMRELLIAGFCARSAPRQDSLEAPELTIEASRSPQSDERDASTGRQNAYKSAVTSVPSGNRKPDLRKLMSMNAERGTNSETNL